MNFDYLHPHSGGLQKCCRMCLLDPLWNSIQTWAHSCANPLASASKMTVFLTVSLVFTIGQGVAIRRLFEKR
jgi:hypothetical protein